MKLRYSSAAFVAALAIPSFATADQPPTGDFQAALIKVHADALAAHIDIQGLLERSALAHGRAMSPPKSFNRTVYGYLPYWSDEANAPWEHITHLSYFSVEINNDGSLGNSHGWSTNGAALVDVGHSYGVQVTLTATLFDDAAITTLLGDPTRQQSLIDDLVNIVAAQGGDGVNIDFEFVGSSRKAQFVSFITDLTNAFHAAISGSHVSLATPAVDWNGSYDYDLLAENSDGLNIMGYGYHWSGGSPGPLSPISAGTTWTSRSLSWTINDYKTWGGDYNRRKFILGLPLYGREWQTVDATVPGQAVAGTSGASRILTVCDSSFAAGKLWDFDSQTPYRVFTDAGGQTRQLFCEDVASMQAKFDLIEAEDLGGVMFWALGYAGASHPMWAESDAHFVDPSAGGSGGSGGSGGASGGSGGSGGVTGSSGSGGSGGVAGSSGSGGSGGVAGSSSSGGTSGGSQGGSGGAGGSSDSPDIGEPTGGCTAVPAANPALALILLLLGAMRRSSTRCWRAESMDRKVERPG